MKPESTNPTGTALVSATFQTALVTVFPTLSSHNYITFFAPRLRRL